MKPIKKGCLCRLLRFAQSLGRGSIYDVWSSGSHRVKVFTELLHKFVTYYHGPKITDWQRQIILGTILGGSSIVRPKGGRNSYLSMRGKDAYWLEFKSQELKNLASPTPFLIENENKYFRWHSLCYPDFNDLHDQFYAGGKKQVTMDLLNELRDIGLAVWYLDGGKLEKGQISFNTNVYKEEGTKIINDYFNEIGIKATSSVKPSSYRVILSEDGTEQLFKVISYRVPQFMLHRLCEAV